MSTADIPFLPACVLSGVRIHIRQVSPGVLEWSAVGELMTEGRGLQTVVQTGTANSWEAAAQHAAGWVGQRPWPRAG